MKFPQCVYNDESFKGTPDCEYKIIESFEEFKKLPKSWGKKQRLEWGLNTASDTLDVENLASEIIDENLDAFDFPMTENKPKRGRKPKQ